MELGVVIGKRGINISEANAFEHVFGYTVINDVSWRDAAAPRRTMGKGKSLDGSCPMGPCIVTADAIDPNNLEIKCSVNGVMKQSSNTKHLYFKIPRLIRDLHGSNAGAGRHHFDRHAGRRGLRAHPPEFMKVDDLLETDIEGIGVMRNPIGRY